jgi:hypothetical protein
MIRSVLITAIVLPIGLVTAWPLLSHEPNAAFTEGLIHPVVQAGKPAPGGPIVPQVAPRPVLPPRFPAETALPAELVQAQRIIAAPSPLQGFPNTFEGRTGKLNFISRTNALQPSAPPPEMQMLTRAMLPPNAPRRSTPTLQELRSYLLAEPGGREMLEEAKRRGLRLSRLPSEKEAEFSIAHLFLPAEVQAAEGFKAVYTMSEPKDSALTLTGIWVFDPARPLMDATVHFGSPQGKTFAVFNVKVPREGMYYVNVIAYMSSAVASLVKANTVIRRHDYGAGSAIYNHWGYVHLAPGSHTFFWFLERGTADFMEVSVQEDV